MVAKKSSKKIETEMFGDLPILQRDRMTERVVDVLEQVESTQSTAIAFSPSSASLSRS